MDQYNWGAARHRLSGFRKRHLKVVYGNCLHLHSSSLPHGRVAQLLRTGEGALCRLFHIITGVHTSQESDVAFLKTGG
ncbi:hypothetical protein [Arthrobacter sp. 3Tela_A]|uniref:hypothetical protein n=1 Tax=Arthrobacter sp. 3Tela_A TaxID=3093743 RepID=UPI003BB62B45